MAHPDQPRTPNASDADLMPPRAKGPLRFRLLGGFHVQVGPRIIEASEWRLRKVTSLVKLLALANGHRLHREQLMDTLWPDSDPDAAAINLRHTLHVARRTLGHTDASPLLPVRGDQVALECQGGVVVDVEVFETAAAPARRTGDPAAYRRALRLYTGDLLPDDRYEEWVRDKCERLRHTHIGLLLELAGLYRERGELPQAIECLRQAVTAEPTNEEAHAELMRLYALSGHRSQAQAQYETLKAILERELDAAPDGTTERLYLAIAAGAPPRRESEQPSDQPGVHSEPPRHNLPTSLTSFIGREREVFEVERLLATTRLLTLTGAGGSGKTRLAMEAGAGLVGEYPGGVWLVGLAALSEPALIPQAAMEALGLREQPGLSPTEVIAAALQGCETLLLLDNCEHLVGACAELAQTLLTACPILRILATSREPLDSPAELTWRVPSLSMPSPVDTTNLDTLMESESVRLFIDRASHRQSGFDLTPGNAHAVAEICRRLDGIPLAIELAAARTRTMTTEHIASRLAGDPRASLGLLAGGNRTAPTRQQTLTATLDWSHGLLSEPERTLFRRLSAFAGGWTLEAAEALCADGVVSSSDVLDLLSQLVDKSLVVLDGVGGGRYRYLEPVRQYAAGKLDESGEAEAIRRRHAEWVLARVEQPHGSEGSADSDESDARWLDELETELGNLRAALSWSLASGPAETALRLIAHSAPLWGIRGLLTEGRRWMDAALARKDEAPLPLAGAALIEAGFMAHMQDDPDRARPLLEESLGIARQLDLPAGIARCLGYLARVAIARAEYDRASELCEEALRIYEERNWSIGIADVSQILGEASMAQGEYEQAGLHFQRAAALFGELGDRRDRAFCLLDLATIAASRGEPGHARDLTEQALDLHRQVGDRAGVATGLHRLAELTADQVDIGQARALYEQCLHLARDASTPPVVYGSLVGLAHLDLLGGEYGRADARCREAMGVRQAAGHAGGIGRALTTLGLTALAKGEYSTARQHLETALTLCRERGDKAYTPVPLEGLGMLASKEGQYGQAEALFEEGLALYRQMGMRPGTARMLTRLAAAALHQGDDDAAIGLIRESLMLFREIGPGIGRDDCLEVAASVAAVRGQPVRAARLFGAVDKERESRGIRTELFGDPGSTRHREATRFLLGTHALEREQAAGRAMTPERAIECALGEDEPSPHTVQTVVAQRPQPGETVLPLTLRECEVATLIARGHTNRQIASELGLSERTVHSHVRRILSKLELESRAQIAVWATEHQLLPTGEAG
jgi:predicted ATPase/DNA-binding SARP family transcriptional activator/DNA-binding CsgD family transcriptional regulator